MLLVRSKIVAVIAGFLLIPLSLPGWAAAFQATNLVTDNQIANAGQITDAGLVNGWGLAFSPTGPFWVSSNGAGTSTIYNVDPSTQITGKAGLTVTIPPGGGSVTGQVFNGSAAAFNGNNFLFVNEDGTISGWRGALGSTAETLVVANPANVYKGAAFGTIGSDSYLYAANFRTGSIDVLKGNPGSPNLSGSFTDPIAPSGFAPFNIQRLGDSLYVAYAQQDSAKLDEVAGQGLGFVDRFDLQGQFQARVATGGTLNAPWGMALAPSSFGALAGALLVGNFGDGRINAYDATTHAFLGQILGPGNTPLTIDGLWALSPGNGVGAGSSALLYFTAGPNGEAHGLFGVLTPVPEPATAWLWVVGIGLLGAAVRRGRLAAGMASDRARR